MLIKSIDKYISILMIKIENIIKYNFCFGFFGDLVRYNFYLFVCI